MLVENIPKEKCGFSQGFRALRRGPAGSKLKLLVFLDRFGQVILCADLGFLSKAKNGCVGLPVSVLRNFAGLEIRMIGQSINKTQGLCFHISHHQVSVVH